MIYQNIFPANTNLITLYIIFALIDAGIMIFIIISILRHLRNKREEWKSLKIKTNIYNLQTWFLFFQLILIANVLVFSMLIISIVSGEIPTEILKLVEKSVMLLLYTAVFVKILYLEYVLHVLRIYKGYFFSIIVGIVIIILIFVPIKTLREPSPLQYIFLGLIILGYGLLPILYFYLAIKSTGDARKNALLISSAMVLRGIGALMQPSNISAYYGINDLIDLFINTTYITGPILLIISSILIYISFKDID